MKKLTIGMASYNNIEQVWYTIMSLLMYHLLPNKLIDQVEILVVDNFGHEGLQKMVVNCWAVHGVRYVLCNGVTGTAAPRNAVFSEAEGQWVMCIDSHVMLAPGAIKDFLDWVDANHDCLDLLQGPMVYDDQITKADAWDPVWDGNMIGLWRNAQPKRMQQPYEIPMMGLGLFACRKDAWLGFNPDFRGFGGEEHYIHEKYKKAGHRTLCLPWLQWIHWFSTRDGVMINSPHTPTIEGVHRNYRIGFAELGLDPTDMEAHYGRQGSQLALSTPAPPLAVSKIRNVQIDTNANCGSKCWFCPVRYIDRPAGQVMPQDLFEKILDDVIANRGNDWTLWLSSYNDILLDPMLRQRLQALRVRGLRFTLLTNGIGLLKNLYLIHEYRDVIAGASVNLPAGVPEGYCTHAGGTVDTFESIVKGLNGLFAIDPELASTFMVCVNGAYDDQPGLKYQMPIGDSDRQATVLQRRLHNNYPVSIARPLADRAGHLVPYALDNNARPQGLNCDNCGDRLTEWLHINSFGQLYFCCQDYLEESIYADLREVNLAQALSIDHTTALKKAHDLCRKCCFNYS